MHLKLFLFIFLKNCQLSESVGNQNVVPQGVFFLVNKKPKKWKKLNEWEKWLNWINEKGRKVQKRKLISD